MKPKVYFSWPEQVVVVSNDYGNVSVAIKEWGLVDVGIGSYEYFGHKGVDKRLMSEIQEIEVVEVDGVECPKEALDYIREVLLDKYEFVAEF